MGNGFRSLRPAERTSLSRIIPGFDFTPNLRLPILVRPWERTIHLSRTAAQPPPQWGGFQPKFSPAQDRPHFNSLTPQLVLASGARSKQPCAKLHRPSIVAPSRKWARIRFLALQIDSRGGHLHRIRMRTREG